MSISNKVRVFEFLYNKSDSSYNINQIARLVGISVGSSFKILKEFERLRYVAIKRKNNAYLYRISLNHKTRSAYEKIGEEKYTKEKKRVKIIGTIGASSNNIITIKRLIENGMDAARIDVSNCSEDVALEMVNNTRAASGNIPILIDIPKPFDRHWLKFSIKNDVDFIAVSGITGIEGIRKINRLLGYSSITNVIGEKIKVVAKVEKGAMQNYREIVQEAYGIMVDRNSLAPETKYEDIPKLQKAIISECNKHGKPVITATAMLGSMVCSSQPTKAEICDIANAVLDGTSCLMLCDETATGKYPLEAVETMSRVIKSAEMGQKEGYAKDILEADLAHSIGKAVSEVDKILDIDAVIIITSGGYSARMISGRRLRTRIIAATSGKKIFRQLNILWGVEPLLVDKNLEDISNDEKKEVILKAFKKGLIRKRDQIAIIASVFHSKSKRVNLLEVHKVNEFLDYVKNNRQKIGNTDLTAKV